MIVSRVMSSALLLMLCGQLVSVARAAEEGRTEDLLSLKDDFQKRVRLNEQVSAVPSQDPAKPGLVVTIQPGKASAPGISLKPAGGVDTWDLSAFGHVEATVVNTGSEPVRFSLRVDNVGDWKKAPYSTGQIDLQPGERGTLPVVFGYQYAQKGYPLDPKHIVNILMYAGNSDSVTFFRIESLVAGGPAGETRDVRPRQTRLMIKRNSDDPASAGAKLDPKVWKLVWADEFDYTGLPDPEKWGYEVGYKRNREPQYYTQARKENAWVEGGVLTITAVKEKFPLPPPEHNYKGGTDADYTSASLTSKESWMYGRIETRAKLPKGRGAWAALWTGGIKGGWPVAGEIDIMEYWASKLTVTSNLHFALAGKHTGVGGGVDVENPWDDFHVYAVQWSTERMDFFCDGVKYYTFDLAKADDKDFNPYRHPHKLLLNLALVGGKDAVDDSSLPQKFVVDYVRVYQPAEAAK